MSNAMLEMYKKRLAQSQQNYKIGKENAKKNLYGPKDPGLYKLQLQEISIDEVTVKEKNVLVARIEHQILESPNDNDIGDIIYDSLFLEGVQSEFDRTDEFIIRFFNSLGCEAPENKEDLPEAFQMLVALAPVYLAKVVLTKDKRFNRVRIMRVIEEKIDNVNEKTKQEENKKEQIEQNNKKTLKKDKNINFETLVEFGTTFGLDLSTMTMEEAIEELSKYPWNKSQLLPEEIQLLINIGLENKIIEDEIN